HNAIQRRQFSVGESSPLDNLLPAGPDPSRRLQQYLVSRIRSERWSKQRISRALAEAGPVADQVLYEVSDDPRLVKLVKQVRKRLGL
ncbi:MAG: hypothetical protein REI11_09770, partial [Patulibacter sp.]|nr:hypothetical protein [Patulibacter sp.]